jgi:hypothetical protein
MEASTENFTSSLAVIGIDIGRKFLIWSASVPMEKYLSQEDQTAGAHRHV